MPLLRWLTSNPTLSRVSARCQSSSAGERTRARSGRSRLALVVVATLLSQSACLPSLGWLLSASRFRPLHLRHIREAPESVPAPTAYELLRVTTRDGDLTVAYAWRFDQLGQTLHAQGIRFDPARHRKSDGEQVIAFADIAEIEGIRGPNASEPLLTSRLWKKLASQAASSMAMASAVVLCREMSPTACAVPIERGSDVLEPVWDTYNRPGDRQR